MPVNNFKPFAAGSGANVTSQSDYEALPSLLGGFQSGKASSAQINKALRQGTLMSSVLAQFIADSSGNDVLDDGDTTTILNNLLLAIKANGGLSFLQISNNFSEISSAGAPAQSAARASLALGTASQRGVGTGINQIPDMSSFNAGTLSAFKLPTGHIVQTGGGLTTSGGFSVNFPIPFPTQCTALIPVIYASTGQRQFIVANNGNRLQANMNVVDTSGNGVNGVAVGYIAIGY